MWNREARPLESGRSLCFIPVMLFAVLSGGERRETCGFPYLVCVLRRFGYILRVYIAKIIIIGEYRGRCQQSLCKIDRLPGTQQTGRVTRNKKVGGIRYPGS